LAEPPLLNTPAKKYINLKTHVYMFPNKTPPARNVKIRRVRGLAALGVAAAVVAFVVFLLVAQPGAGADAGGAYQYAGFT
jgi:hypothetical protein